MDSRRTELPEKDGTDKQLEQLREVRHYNKSLQILTMVGCPRADSSSPEHRSKRAKTVSVERAHYFFW